MSHYRIIHPPVDSQAESRYQEKYGDPPIVVERSTLGYEDLILSVAKMAVANGGNAEQWAQLVKDLTKERRNGHG